jgi:hypothetical protein
MKKILKVFSRNLLNSAKDLAPIVLAAKNQSSE